MTTIMALLLTGCRFIFIFTKTNKVVRHGRVLRWHSGTVKGGREEEAQRENRIDRRTRGKCRVKITFWVAWRHPIYVSCIRAQTRQQRSDRRSSPFISTYSTCYCSDWVWMWNRNATTIDATMTMTMTTMCGLFGVNWFLWIFYTLFGLASSPWSLSSSWTLNVVSPEQHVLTRTSLQLRPVCDCAFDCLLGPDPAPASTLRVLLFYFHRCSRTFKNLNEKPKLD